MRAAVCIAIVGGVGGLLASACFYVMAMRFAFVPSFPGQQADFPALDMLWAVYADFPSVTPPGLASLYMPVPKWLFSLALILVIVVVNFTSWMAAWLVAPANRVGDILVGAATSLVFCLTLFTFFWGPYLVFGRVVAASWTDVRTLAQAGADPNIVAQSYPDLQAGPAAERGDRLARKILADMTARIPSSVWSGMLIALACSFVGPLMARWGGERARGGERPSAALTADWNDWLLLVLTTLGYVLLLVLFLPSLFIQKFALWLVWFLAAYTLAKAWGLEDNRMRWPQTAGGWLLQGVWIVMMSYIFVSWFLVTTLWIDLLAYVIAFVILIPACRKQRQAL